MTKKPEVAAPWINPAKAPAITQPLEESNELPQINVATDNPFAPKVREPAPERKPTLRPDGTPMWGPFVTFVQKHAAIITQVRYPDPLGECIDTIRKGIRVYDHEEAMVRHIDGQWVTWADAQAIDRA